MGNDQSNVRKGDKAEPGEIGVNPANAEVENSLEAYGFTVQELKEWAVELELDPGSDDPSELLNAITEELINIELVKLGMGNGENGETMKASGHESVIENVETSVKDMEVGSDSESGDTSSEAKPLESTKRKHEEEDEQNSGDYQATSSSKCGFKVRKVCPQDGHEE